MTSLLTNARAVGQGLNPGFIFLNLFGGVLDAKLEVRHRMASSCFLPSTGVFRVHMVTDKLRVA